MHPIHGETEGSRGATLSCAAQGTQRVACQPEHSTTTLKECGMWASTGQQLHAPEEREAGRDRNWCAYHACRLLLGVRKKGPGGGVNKLCRTMMRRPVLQRGGLLGFSRNRWSKSMTSGGKGSNNSAARGKKGEEKEVPLPSAVRRARGDRRWLRADCRGI